jgi:hypothetical protein
MEHNDYKIFKDSTTCKNAMSFTDKCIKGTKALLHSDFKNQSFQSPELFKLGKCQLSKTSKNRPPRTEHHSIELDLLLYLKGKCSAKEIMGSLSIRILEVTIVGCELQLGNSGRKQESQALFMIGCGQEVGEFYD